MTTVPEPSTWVMLVIGCGIVGLSADVNGWAGSADGLSAIARGTISRRTLVPDC